MIVSCVVYQAGHKISDIPLSEIPVMLTHRDYFVWVALHDPTDQELADVQADFGLHELAVEDARNGHQRPKVEEYGQSLFVVLNVFEIVNGEFSQGEVAIFVGPQYVVSVRRNVTHGFADVRVRSEQEPELLKHGSAYVLYALMDAVVDRYFPVLDRLTDEISDVEEHIFSGHTSRPTLEALYGLKGKLLAIRHATSQQLEATGKLYGGRVPPICSGLQDYFRDISDHLQRLGQQADSLQDMVTTAISVNLSLLTIQESEITKRLAAYAALVAVPTLIAGVYGMNFAHMPELDWVWGYPLSISSMIAIDLYLYFRFKKSGWM